jgi:hypothetical protein
VLPNIHLHWEYGPRKSVFWKPTDTMKPNMMPNAVLESTKSVYVSYAVRTCSYVPHLPHHCQGTTNVLWRRLCSVDGSGRGLCSDGETEKESRNEQVRPVVGRSHPYTSNERDDAGNEDGTTASKVFVEGRVRPTTDESGAQVWGTVKQTLVKSAMPPKIQIRLTWSQTSVIPNSSK